MNWIAVPTLIPLGFWLGDTVWRWHQIFENKEHTRLWAENSLATLILAWSCQCLCWAGLDSLSWLLVAPALLVLLFTIVLGLAKMLHVL